MAGTDDADALVARALADAVAAPTPEQVRALAAQALDRGSADMDPEEIRALAAQAVAQAVQVSRLLNRLAALTEHGGH